MSALIGNFRRNSHLGINSQANKRSPLKRTEFKLSLPTNGKIRRLGWEFPQMSAWLGIFANVRRLGINSQANKRSPLKTD